MAANTGDVVTDAEHHGEPGASSVMLLSFHHRDALAAALSLAGWQVTAARRADRIERRFAESDAIIYIIDARGAFAEGLRIAESIAALASINGAALLIISDRTDAATKDEIFAAGATHILCAPFTDHDVLLAVQLARRYVERVAGGMKPTDMRAVSAKALETRDKLTGLRDARSTRAWINMRMANGAHKLALLLVSISRFDMVNAAFGVDTGDTVLRNLGHRIEPLVADLGKETLLARIAGAEFAICVDDDVTVERLTILAEALAAAIERPISTGTDVVRLGCRIGVVQRDVNDKDASQFLKRANSALAQAKDFETGRICMMIGDRATVAANAAALQSDLRSALMHDEIEILFQPQVDIVSGKITGVEALARWRHPVHGELGAATLFSVAERSDYLLELSDHIQKRAVKIAAVWPDPLGALRLSINVTAIDMARPGFVEGLLDMVDESSFPRERLTIEITESGLMEDLSAASDILARLRAAGCRVAIDDFGTGYSSLAYLKALPLDYLKIDKGLVADIEGSTRDSIVVRGVIDMARSLGLAVVAEGVETEAQLGLLAREGCNYYQGFLCAEPLDVSALAGLVGRMT